MYDVIIYGTGKNYNKYFNLIKFWESTDEINIVGVTSDDEYIKELDGYKFIKKKDLNKYHIDYFIVTCSCFFDVIKEIEKYDFYADALIPARILEIPGFSFKEYINIKERNISLITKNCFGGLLFNTLGLRFNSPFVNMFLLDGDYMALLNNLRDYMKTKIVFKEKRYDSYLKVDYPVGLLGDIELHFNHYKTFEEAESKWYSRLERFNWDDIFVIYYTENLDMIQWFDKLLFKNKVCFVPFKCEVQSAYYIPKKSQAYGLDVNEYARIGSGAGINLIKLLSEAKVFSRYEYSDK